MMTKEEREQLYFDIRMMEARRATEILVNDSYTKAMERVDIFFENNPLCSDGEPYVVCAIKNLISAVREGEISKGEAFESLLYSIHLFTE